MVFGEPFFGRTILTACKTNGTTGQTIGMFNKTHILLLSYFVPFVVNLSRLSRGGLWKTFQLVPRVSRVPFPCPVRISHKLFILKEKSRNPVWTVVFTQSGRIRTYE